MHTGRKLGPFLHDRRLHIACAYLLVALAFIPGIWSNPRHEGDEANWIAGSLYFEQYMGIAPVRKSWDRVLWKNSQSPMTFFLIGAGRRLGGFDSTELNKRWNYGASMEKNAAKGRRPSDELVRWARLPMALLAVCLAHRVVRACAGELAGYAWLLLCIANGYLRLHLVRAMCEAPLVACCVLALWVMSRTLTLTRSCHSPTPRSALLGTAAFGVVSGLATSSKLNGLTLLAPGVLMVAVLTALLRPRLRRPIVFFIAALLLLGTTALTVVRLDPYLPSVRCNRGWWWCRATCCRLVRLSATAARHRPLFMSMHCCWPWGCSGSSGRRWASYAGSRGTRRRWPSCSWGHRFLPRAAHPARLGSLLCPAGFLFDDGHHDRTRLAGAARAGAEGRGPLTPGVTSRPRTITRISAIASASVCSQACANSLPYEATLIDPLHAGDRVLVQ